MGKGAKLNPRRRPATQADINKANASNRRMVDEANARLEATRQELLAKEAELQRMQAEISNALSRDAVYAAWAIMLYTLGNRWGWGKSRKLRLWGDINDVSDSIDAGYLCLEDIFVTLEEEDNITFEGRRSYANTNETAQC